MFQDNLSKRTEINPRIMVGKPVIKGTRIPVEIILRKLAQNVSIDKILQDYPRLTSKDIQAALEYAAESVREEEVHYTNGLFIPHFFYHISHITHYCICPLQLLYFFLLFFDR